MKYFTIFLVNFAFIDFYFLAQFIGLKHARASIVIAKLKEIELTFRNLVDDGNDGNEISSKIPYQKTDLPIEKITKICQKVSQSSKDDVNELDASLFEEILQFSEEIMQSIKMSNIFTEKESFNEENNENEGIKIEEEEKESSASGTDDECES